MVFVHQDQRSYKRIAFFYVLKRSYGMSNLRSNAFKSRQVCLTFFQWAQCRSVVPDSPPPPPSLPPSQMTNVFLGRDVIDDQFSLPKLHIVAERIQDPGGYQYFVVEK